MGQTERHPPGLYVLFATELWERFSFYSMLAMFTLYLQDPAQGFGWSKAEATTLYSYYMMFVYASPLVGGLIADRGLGYRRSVILGGFFFMAGHLLLSFRDLTAVYAALTCLVIGNGFFKPNVSALVGKLYREGSPLKDYAYNIFYMGINIGAFLAPVTMEVVKSQFGYHPAFAVAAFGMVISVCTLWWFRQFVRDQEPAALPEGDAEHGIYDPARREQVAARQAAAAVAVTEDVPPPGVNRPSALEQVPDWMRVGALVLVFALVIVFWMVFHQNGATLTYWANDNTDWQVSGVISNAINPFWVVTLTFPLIWFWQQLNRRGWEPSTPTKMAIGMTLTGLSFFLLALAARTGEATVTGSDPYAFRVSPLWLISAYAIVTLGELMLSPMGLSLVSKVAPVRMRGLMMGGWFVATAIGNKLTAIGVYWTEWLHSTFFAVLGGMALAMAVVFFLLLKPLKKAMPGV